MASADPVRDVLGYLTEACRQVEHAAGTSANYRFQLGRACMAEEIARMFGATEDQIVEAKRAGYRKAFAEKDAAQADQADEDAE